MYRLFSDLQSGELTILEKDKPFYLMLHDKAPHCNWSLDEKHKHMYEDIDIPEPEIFNDDYSNRADAAKEATMRINRDLLANDLKETPPAGLADAELKNWKYQRYIKDYHRVCSLSRR